MKKSAVVVLPGPDSPILFKGRRFPPEVISYAVWLYYWFPAARGIELTYETVRCWARKFGLGIAKRIRSTPPASGNKWHLDEMVVICGVKHWLWRAVDQGGAVLDVLVQRCRCQSVDAQAAQAPRPPARDGDRQAS